MTIPGPAPLILRTWRLATSTSTRPLSLAALYQAARAAAASTVSADWGCQGSPADHHVRAADAARVQPCRRTGDVEGDELVLTAAAADVDCSRWRRRAPAAGAGRSSSLAVLGSGAACSAHSAARASSSEIPAPARSMLPTDRDRRSPPDSPRPSRQLCLRALRLAVALEVGLGVLVRGQTWIERDRCAVDVQRV